MYKIVRVYENNMIPRRTIETRLTREEAQEHCRNPETSSRTCTNKVGKQRTKKLGQWFDTYYED